MQDFTLHTHTIGFDGKNTPAEMIAAARAAGMQAIGISNHFIVHPKIKWTNFYQAATKRGYNAIYAASFDEVLNRFAPHYEELANLAAKSDIKVLRGMEVDFFDTPEWRDGFEQAKNILRPDYTIGAVHLVEYQGALYNMHDIKAAPWHERVNTLVAYCGKVRRAGKSGLFTWLAHVDLSRKGGPGDYDKLFESFHRGMIKGIAKSGTPIEINATPYDNGEWEPYPSRSIMKMVAQHNIPVLISDDAHSADQIGRHFTRAEQFARDCGVKNFLTLQKILDFRHKTL